jgi:antitoxin (DNA-binding transcriptional repressor) of toxin-antitoxin stability system
MSLQTLSATKARNNFFDLLDQVLLGKSFVVERNDKPVAMISNIKAQTDLKQLKIALKITRGILSKTAYAGKDNVLRSKKAKRFLGNW